MPSTPVALRLSPATRSLLDRAVSRSNESRNAYMDRLLGEALRTEGHPLIRYGAGAAGRREPFLVGTRLRVRDVVTLLEETPGSREDAVAETAEDLGIGPHLIRAAEAYGFEFHHELQVDRAWAEQVAGDERRRSMPTGE